MRSLPWLLFVVLAVLLIGGGAMWWNQRTLDAPHETQPAMARANVDGPATRDGAPDADVRRQAVVAIDPEPAPDAPPEIHGTVRDPAGNPVVGARVAISRCTADEYGLLDREYARERREVAATMTDGEGRYRAIVTPRRPHRVTVEAEGLADARRDGVFNGNRVDFVLGLPATLRGIVLQAEDRAPIAEARLRGWRRGGLGGAIDLFEGASDAAGEFVFEGLAPGPCTLAASSADRAGPRWQKIELVAGETTTVEILVPRGVDVQGVVLDDVTSRPIEGAVVREGRDHAVTTDADGRFALPGFYSRAQLDVDVEAVGYPPVEWPVVVRGSGEVLREIEVRLRRGRRAHGRVCDASGVPLQGVYAAATASDHEAPQGGQRTDWVATRSREDGTFDLESLRSELEHTLFLRAEGHATMVYDFPAGELDVDDLDLGTFRLQRPASLSGRLADEFGEPIANYEVKLIGWNRDRFRDRPVSAEPGYRSIDGYVAEREAVTGEDGSFAFDDLAAGDYRIRAFLLDSHASAEVPVSVDPGQHLAGVEMTLPRGLSITGTVTASDGGPPPTCYLSVDGEDGQTTNADLEVPEGGAFEVRGLQAGNYRITAYPYASERDRASGRSFQSLKTPHVAAGSAGLSVVVPVSLPIPGVVLQSSGQPASGVTVRVADGERIHSSGTTDELGRFTLNGPVARFVEVQVIALGEQGAEGPVLARAVIQPGGDAITLTLQN